MKGFKWVKLQIKVNILDEVSSSEESVAVVDYVHSSYRPYECNHNTFALTISRKGVNHNGQIECIVDREIKICPWNEDNSVHLC